MSGMYNGTMPVLCVVKHFILITADTVVDDGRGRAGATDTLAGASK